jgi:hypothetical protein
MALAFVVAIGLIVVQGVAIIAFLKFVKSFGTYAETQRQLTAAILTTHESNLLLHREQVRMLEELRSVKPLHVAVA